jgi:hypothetical protein
VARELCRLMTMALSARALLAVAFAGALILGILAVCIGRWPGFVALAIYGLTTVLPITIIETWKK